MESLPTTERNAAAADDHLLAGRRTAVEDDGHGHLVVLVLLDAVLRVDVTFPASTGWLLRGAVSRLLQRTHQSCHLRLPQSSSAKGSCQSPINHLLSAVD